MAKNSRLSRDQKRKSKLKERERKARQSESLAYHGSKYKRDDLVTLYYEAESGIHEADRATGFTMTDRDAALGLEFLIRTLRRSPLPETAEFPELGEPQSLIAANVVERWQRLFAGFPPKKDDLIGVLRSTLGSIETRRDMHGGSRGYLEYLGRFLKRVR